MEMCGAMSANDIDQGSLGIAKGGRLEEAGCACVACMLCRISGAKCVVREAGCGCGCDKRASERVDEWRQLQLRLRLRLRLVCGAMLCALFVSVRIVIVALGVHVDRVARFATVAASC